MTDIDQTILDNKKPNAGRIYDYWLGGSQNFEVDRIAGDEIVKHIPFIRELATLVRWFLGKGVKRALELGFTQFLDFASGVPSTRHIQSLTPEGTKIVYSDIDPVTVRLGKKILKDNPLIKYEFCDIRIPETLLESDVVKNLFGANHKVAIGYNGICYFLKDEEIHYSMNALYEWAAEGSILYFCDIDLASGQTSNAVFDLYKNMNQPFYSRPQKEMIELIKPWRVMEPGFQDLEKWHNKPSAFTEKYIALYGGGGFYGGFLIK
jgi:hypothetical protein